MKYSITSLDLAIETILPHVKKAKDAGALLQRARTDLMKDVAVEYFTSTTPFDQEKMMCLGVVRTAMKELSKEGQIEFGDKELSEEINQYREKAISMSRPDSLN
jgi:hypothetical protein